MLTQDSRCEDIINSMLLHGGVIIIDKQEGSVGCMGRTVVIENKNCKVKVGYLNFGDRQLIVNKHCCCNDETLWKSIPAKCLTDL